MDTLEEMPPSYRTIDYSLRPAKHTERRMLCDVFRKLSAFYKLSDYTYVGFGGIEFSDFILFHKSLGIPHMISMEESPDAQKRLDFNKPFNAVEIICEHSSKVLPKLDWENPHILWLDYDDPLKVSMFNDVDTVSNHAMSGTALAFSFQCNSAPETESTDAPIMTSFEAVFGRNRIPLGTVEDDLYSWKYGELGQRMLLAEIEEGLAKRNARLPQKQKLSFKKICTIQYKDGAKMHTVVGVFVSEADEELFNNCEFKELDFLMRAKTVKIEVPPLTIREIRSLEQQLPLNKGASLVNGVIPAKEAEQFHKLYKYLPNFSVLEN